MKIKKTIATLVATVVVASTFAVNASAAPQSSTVNGANISTTAVDTSGTGSSGSSWNVTNYKNTVTIYRDGSTAVDQSGSAYGYGVTVKVPTSIGYRCNYAKTTHQVGASVGNTEDYN